MKWNLSGPSRPKRPSRFPLLQPLVSFAKSPFKRHRSRRPHVQHGREAYRNSERQLSETPRWPLNDVGGSQPAPAWVDGAGVPITNLFFRLEQAHLPRRRRDIGLCSRSWCGQARFVPHSDCRSTCKSSKPSCAAVSACRNRLAKVRYLSPIHQPAARIAACSGDLRDLLGWERCTRRPYRRDAPEGVPDCPLSTSKLSLRGKCQ
jgi:hypothetical protein